MNRIKTGNLFATLTLALALSSANVFAQDGNKILKDHFKAVNAEKLEKTSTYTITGSMSIMGMDGPVTVYVKNPDKMRTEVTVMGMSVVSVRNGDKGYMAIPGQGVKEMSANEMKGGSQNPLFEAQLYDKFKSGKTKVLSAEKTTLNNTDAYKVKVAEDGKDTTDLYFDTKTNNLVKMEAKKEVQGEEGQIVITFSDFHTVDGMVLAYAISTDANGQKAADIKIDKVTFNDPIDDKQFAKPTE